MKKLLILLLCISLLCGICSFSVACKDDAQVPEVDMTLRSDVTYGLYWYGDSGEQDDKLISQENMPVQYYDPSKPTLIYSHGWKPEGDDREELSTLAKTISKTEGASGNVNYVKELKELGYNVAFWDWYDYAKSLDHLQNEIWTIKSADEIADKYENYKAAVTVLDGRTFAGEFARSVYAVMKNASDKEVVFVGHSFGGEMVTAAAYTLYKLADMGVITNTNMLPDRISLADPYIPAATISGEMDLVEEQANTYVALMMAYAFEYINAKGAVIDLNGAMDGLTYNGYIAIKDSNVKKGITQKIKDNTVYVIQTNLQAAYSAIGDVHNVSRDWVITTFIEGKKGNMSGCVPNNSMTAEELRPYVGREFEFVGEGFDVGGVSMKEITAE